MGLLGSVHIVLCNAFIAHPQSSKYTELPGLDLTNYAAEKLNTLI